MKDIELGDRNIVVEMHFGSTLYGTETPESDQDFKGIFLPTKEEVLLSRVPKSIRIMSKSGDAKNSKDDIDREFYSLPYFISLACAGVTNVLDMLHAPDDMLLRTSLVWEHIVQHRAKFYTKTLKSLVGYARKQAAKYGIKGSRIHSLRGIIAFLESVVDKNSRLGDWWDDLPDGDHIHRLSSGDPRFMFYQVCGRKFLDRMKVSEALSIVNKIHDNASDRAKGAANNKGIDWKALSHAIRAAMEVIEIFEHKTITFPLVDAVYIKRVKSGQLDYLTDVAPVLEGLMDRCEALSAISDLPEHADVDFWEEFLCDVIMNEVLAVDADPFIPLLEPLSRRKVNVRITSVSKGKPRNYAAEDLF